METTETPYFINKKRSNICKKEGCNVQPSYGNEWKKPEYCKNHIKEGMIDVKHERCKKEGCNVQPSYGNEWKKPEYCKNHIKEGMIDVKHERCKKEGCNARPSYGKEGEKPEYCKNHKNKGMVDVIHKRCKKEGCNVRPSYGFEWKKPEYCKEDKKEGMIDVISKRCKKEGCNTLPSYGFEWKKPEYCKEDKKEGMIDVINKRCKTELCDTRVGNKYKGYCVFCFIHIFPDEPITRNYKTKEKYINDFVKENNRDVKIISDKIIDGGCSKRRPDILIDMNTHVIIVEVDENQHVGYSCENKRIMEISQDLGHPNIIFIRFNPDGYEMNGKKINSCFKKGICQVRNKKELEKRLNILQEMINKWKKLIPEKLITIEELFYDS